MTPLVARSIPEVPSLVPARIEASNRTSLHLAIAKGAMELAIVPPSRVGVGVVLHQPLVVTFSTSEGDKLPNIDALTLQDTSGIWAFVSLTSADMQETLDPPHGELLRGERTDSIHPIHQHQEGDRVTVAYVRFRELVITKPGSYRFRVSIIDMNDPLGAKSGQGVGTVLPSLHSEIIHVVEGDEPAIDDTANVAARDRLRAIGIDC